MSGEKTKNVKEVHRTDFVDKQLPTITYESIDSKSMTDSKKISISVSGKTAKDAFTVFKNVKGEIDEV